MLEFATNWRNIRSVFLSLLVVATGWVDGSFELALKVASFSFGKTLEWKLEGESGHLLPA